MKLTDEERGEEETILGYFQKNLRLQKIMMLQKQGAQPRYNVARLLSHETNESCGHSRNMNIFVIGPYAKNLCFRSQYDQVVNKRRNI